MQPVRREKRPLTPPPANPSSSPPTSAPQPTDEQAQRIHQARYMAVRRLAAAARRCGMTLPVTPDGWTPFLLRGLGPLGRSNSTF